MFNKFIELVGKHGNLDNSDINYLREHAKITIYKKGESVLTAGKIVRNIYFVLDGCIRLFYDVEGKDKTAFFYHEGSFIWASKSLKYEIPTQKNYEAIEDSVIVKIDKKVLYELMKLSPNFEMITWKEKEQELITYQQLLTYFITLSPEKRFMKLLETNKLLFQRVPQQYIASYLGVSAESLSRIKRRVYEKHREMVYC